MLLPEASGETTVVMLTARDNTEAPRQREEGVVTLGRVTGRPRDPFSGRLADLLREPPARTIVREEVFVETEVVEAGVVGDFAANNLGGLFILMLRLRLSFPQSYLHRRWRW